MSKSDSYDRILDKIDEVFIRLALIEQKLNTALKNDEKKLDLKARDVPLGTVVCSLYDPSEKYKIIAYSKQGDQVVVIEDEDGNVDTKNINDLRILD
jgi:NADH:ubiquinone oxidoreductase subunit D